MELAKNGVLAELIGTGAVVKTAFLRTVLRRRRYTCKQCIQYPSYNQKLPEP